MPDNIVFGGLDLVEEDVVDVRLDTRDNVHLAILENRIRAKGLWNPYITGGILDREYWLNVVNNAFAGEYDEFVYDVNGVQLPAGTPLPNAKFPIKGDKAARMVNLYEDRDTKILESECRYVGHLGGYFKKDDPRVKEDHFIEGGVVVHSVNYMYPKSSVFIKVFTDISDDGVLIWNGTLTSLKSNTRYPVPAIVYTKNQSDFGYIEDAARLKPAFAKNYVENISTGVFYDRLDSNSSFYVRKPKVQSRKWDRNAMSFIEDMKGKPITYTKTYGKKYSFGLEIETISGTVPTYIAKELYCSSVHDGSLREGPDNIAYGAEYVTCVLRGDEGLKQTKKICYELTRRCLVNKQCGVHAHIGDVIFTKENVILMYYLYTLIQDDIFAMLPKSRKGNEYCRPLDPINIDIKNIAPNAPHRNYWIEEYYAGIIALLSLDGGPGYMVNKREDHPMGPKCNYNHRTARYCWVNFVPSVFNTRGGNIYTIEFRPMQASTSYTKIKNWLLICFALVDIVENHKQAIYSGLVTSLNDIIIQCYPKDCESIIAYIDARTEKFKAFPVTDKEGKPLAESLLNKLEQKDFDDNELDNNYSYKDL